MIGMVYVSVRGCGHLVVRVIFLVLDGDVDKLDLRIGPGRLPEPPSARNPDAHIYHPDHGLVEHSPIARQRLSAFKKALNWWKDGQADLPEEFHTDPNYQWDHGPAVPLAASWSMYSFKLDDEEDGSNEGSGVCARGVTNALHAERSDRVVERAKARYSAAIHCLPPPTVAPQDVGFNAIFLSG
eukprot:CAMPEP_0178693188 /NCGR_PEP_ID=MMETSP0699-20121125/7580_1 /TAXON_ID=265572 /ORGANISM="Extubocellulus spinifer, Strain CCMP396" /LENGTH=183 /DNA_ID=CAMNT_0020338585 /DNA_START=355 /DNA_END=907 /DNA_ORIENTATION=-